MEEIFTIIQRNKSRKDGFVFANGIVKSNQSIDEIKDIIYEAWDNVIFEPNAIAREIEITSKNSSNFAKCDFIAEPEVVHISDDKEELYENTDLLMKYISQNVDFVNNLEVVRVLNVSNKENLTNGSVLKELNVCIAKGESNYVYYELNISSGVSKNVETVIEYVDYMVCYE